jgi:AraC-like DNA-binding protein
MEIVLVSNTFRTMIGQRCPYENFCALIHKSSTCLDICKCSDIERYEEASRTEETLTYVCPFGITETIIPIKRNGKTVSYILCSMGIINNDDEEIADNIAHIAPQLHYDAVLDSVKAMPHLDNEHFEAYHTMLKLLAQHIELDDTTLDEQPTIGQLTKKYIKTNLARKITLADLSWNLHCSTVTLTEHFKEEFGITIMDYVASKRMELAEELLIGTEKSIKEVSILSGFPDVEYFSRCFKKFHDAPPGEWRRLKEKKTTKSVDDEMC